MQYPMHANYDHKYFVPWKKNMALKKTRQTDLIYIQKTICVKYLFKNQY